MEIVNIQIIEEDGENLVEITQSEKTGSTELILKNTFTILQMVEIAEFYKKYIT